VNFVDSNNIWGFPTKSIRVKVRVSQYKLDDAASAECPNFPLWWKTAAEARSRDLAVVTHGTRVNQDFYQEQCGPKVSHKDIQKHNRRRRKLKKSHGLCGVQTLLGIRFEETAAMHSNLARAAVHQSRGRRLGYFSNLSKKEK
jgi:hypothetical protein